MKAIVYKKYGPPKVLQIQEVAKPAPKVDEVLIKVYATTVSAADYKIRGFKVSYGFWLPARMMYGLFRPKRTILGTELAGKVEAVGNDVRLFNKGDRVFGMDGANFGAYAEYVCRPEKSALAAIPANMTYEEASAVPHGALAALFFLRDKGKIQAGQDILIYGASGAVGTSAVQIAKYFGAKITGVCSTRNLDLVKSLGAAQVIDYTQEDFTEKGKAYDCIFDTVGKTSFSRCKKVLKPKGRYILTVFDLPQIFQMMWTSILGGKKVVCAIAPERAENLFFVKKIIEEGKLKPVIDRRFSLERAADAHTYAEAGHKKGSVVITIRHSDTAQ
jgi:NADPH:quinone reductase-like Zn-dependent oxidoreductase